MICDVCGHEIVPVRKGADYQIQGPKAWHTHCPAAFDAGRARLATEVRLEILTWRSLSAASLRNAAERLAEMMENV